MAGGAAGVLRTPREPSSIATRTTNAVAPANAQRVRRNRPNSNPKAISTAKIAASFSPFCAFHRQAAGSADAFAVVATVMVTRPEVEFVKSRV